MVSVTTQRFTDGEIGISAFITQGDCKYITITFSISDADCKEMIKELTELLKVKECLK